jgi:hypothetical protein
MSKIIPSLFADFAKENSRSESGFDSNGLPGGSDSENHPINESFAGIVTSFTVYKLMSEIIKPFTAMKAYRDGLIDANGNLLKSESELTSKESAVLTPFDRLVIGIKRLVQALPANKLKTEFNYIQTAAKAMAFECAELGGDGDLFLEELQKSLDVLLEEGEGGPGNVIGGGFLNPQVGDPNPAIAGFSPPLALVRRKKKILTKKDISQ